MEARQRVVALAVGCVALVSPASASAATQLGRLPVSHCGLGLRAGLIGLWRLFRAPRVTLGQIGAGLVLLGVITTIAFFGFGAYEYEAAQPDLDPAQMARLADNVEESGVTTPLFIVTFVVGIEIGSLIVAWSLWRRQVVPPWAPAAIVAGTILGIFSEDSVALGAIGFAFLLVGFGWVGLNLLSMSDDEWDVLGRVPGPAEPPPGPAV